MASKYYGDLVFSTGEYQNDAGETKKRWSKAGAVFRDDKDGRLSIKFEAMPTGIEWSGWMNIFTKDKVKAEKDTSVDIVDSDEPINLNDIPF